MLPSWYANYKLVMNVYNLLIHRRVKLLRQGTQNLMIIAHPSQNLNKLSQLAPSNQSQQSQCDGHSISLCGSARSSCLPLIITPVVLYQSQKNHQI